MVVSASSESTIAVVEDLATVSHRSQGVQLEKLREMDEGGHFAAWEQPQLSTEGVGAAFRWIRS
jgi:hypothetical protein